MLNWGKPGDEAQLALERAGTPLQHEAAADEVGNSPEDLPVLLFLFGGRGAGTLGAHLEARPYPRDRRP
eukprot:8933271-Alexandrium_andersonii.AAC.1